MLDTTHSFVMEVMKWVNRAIAESELELPVYTVGAVRKSVRAGAAAHESSIKITQST